MHKLILAFLLSSLTLASSTYFCTDELEKMPIQQNGRTKPLSVHAKETLKHLTGKKKFGDYSSVQTYCLLTSTAFGLPHNVVLKAKIEHKETKKLLESSEMTFDDLISNEQEIRMAYMKLKKNDGYKKELNKLLAKIRLYNDITRGTNWLIPQSVGTDVTWISITSFITKEKMAVQAKSSSNPFKALFDGARNEYIKIKGDGFMLEYTYDKMRLIQVSMILTLIALAFLVLFKNFKVTLGLSFLLVIIETIYLTMRVYISGRAPVTNMFETVIFSGYGAVVLSLIIGHFKKEKVYVYMGLMYNFCTLMMATFATGMVNESISPLVPVLRDNFWLSTHVTTIIISYGALALSWVLANTLLIKKKFGNLSNQDENYYNDVIYTSLKWGTVLLGAGIILGGVWADYSWGRFWGWDPKETWSLIVLCLYMAILHGKHTAWIPAHRFSFLVAAAFMSVMMAWFGVNYILASGLHSYGFSEGGAIFLGTFFGVQTLVLLLTLQKKKVA